LAYPVRVPRSGEYLGRFFTWEGHRVTLSEFGHELARRDNTIIKI
jgi:hypothetical protein